MEKATFTPTATGFDIDVDGEKFSCRRKNENGNRFWAIFQNNQEIAVALGAERFNHNDTRDRTRQSILNSIV